MSNLGFRNAMQDAGITVVETAVGDRYVLEAMRARQFRLGGEQSGHIIMLDHATTGDGLLTALHLLATAARQALPLADVAAVMTRYPQVLVNVPGVDKSRVTASPEVAAAVAAAEQELGASGRVLVRPSGTEPAVRVMVEAIDSDQAHQSRRPASRRRPRRGLARRPSVRISARHTPGLTRHVTRCSCRRGRGLRRPCWIWRGRRGAWMTRWAGCYALAAAGGLRRRLAAALALRARVRWRAELSAALGLAADGVHSLLEFRYVTRVERPHGLPAGHRQHLVVRAGQRQYQDVTYRSTAWWLSWTGRRRIRPGPAGATCAGTTRAPPWARARSAMAGPT